MRNLKRKKYNATYGYFHFFGFFASAMAKSGVNTKNQGIGQMLLLKSNLTQTSWSMGTETWTSPFFFFFNFVLAYAELEVFEQLSEIPSCLFCSGCMNTNPAYAEHTDQLSNINIQSDLFQMWINCLYAAKPTHACTIKISLKFPRTTKFLGCL